MKKKLPVVGKPTPAQAQKGLAAKPVKGASRPEFPTRAAAYLEAGLLGGAALIAGCGSPSHATTTPTQEQAAVSPAPVDPAPPPAPTPAPPPQQEIAAVPANPPQASEPAPPPEKPAMAKLPDGSIDGQPLAKQTPKFKVYREGGGIGPAEDMWEPTEVEAYIGWTMAKEGKLNLQTQFKYDDLQLDAFDPDKNVGFLYVDKLEGGSESVPKETRDKIDSLMKAKKAAILLIDQKKNPDAATLKGRILKFMAAVKKAPPTGAAQ